MRLREFHAVRILARLFVDDDMSAERNVVSRLNLLKPGYTIAVRLKAGDNVIQPVAIDILREHLSAAVCVGGVTCEFLPGSSRKSHRFSIRHYRSRYASATPSRC